MYDSSIKPEEGQVYTVTLHKVINGNLQSEDISEEDFFS